MPEKAHAAPPLPLAVTPARKHVPVAVDDRRIGLEGAISRAAPQVGQAAEVSHSGTGHFIMGAFPIN
jgi:hypothetical protein